MIIKPHHILGIKSGKISLAFRRWEKPNVKAGSTMRNEMGVIGVDAVEKVDEKSITKSDASKAGYESVALLLKELDKVPKGDVYKIKLSYRSVDPRIELRSQTSVSEEDLQKIKTKLERLDKTGGPWVLKTLKLIEKYPERRAGDLADMMKMERLDFKLRVRKLKNIGLTISHEVGYSISPLGKIVIEKI